MTADQATSDIIELVYHSAVVSDDPWVQEVHTSTAVRDILEELLNCKTVDEDKEYENRRLEQEVTRLEEELAGRDVDFQETVEKLRYTQRLLGEYVGK